MNEITKCPQFKLENDLNASDRSTRKWRGKLAGERKGKYGRAPVQLRVSPYRKNEYD